MTEKFHLIIGNGEIGQAIGVNLQEPHYKNVYYVDLEKSDIIPKTNFDVLHICFGYSENFIEHVIEYSQQYMFSVLCIHSTIPPGTTKELSRSIKNIVYSPVRGRHQETMVKHVKMFPKYYAVSNAIAREYFINAMCPFRLVECDDFDSLEVAKIMSTTYMYWNVIYERELYKYCTENNLDYDFIYREWQESYNDMCNNEIYSEHFKRPIFEHTTGEIGGHCLRPNIHLVDNYITDIIKEWEDGSRFI